MRAFIYSLELAIKNIWYEKWINLLTILSVSVGIFIIGIYMVITLNIHNLLRIWASEFGIVVYLKDGIGENDKKALIQELEGSNNFHDIRFVSGKQALKDLKSYFQKSNTSFGYIEAAMLPESIELKLNQNTMNLPAIKEEVGRLAKLPGVDEVQYGEKWLSSLSALTNSLKVTGSVLGVVIFVAIGFITYSTIKIHFYRRYDEIMTLKLLGASKSFLRWPFLIEGFIVGLLGGIIGYVMVYGLYRYVADNITLPLFLNSLVFLPAAAYPVLPACGVILSFTGALIAIGKIRY
ncbi:MAG TPA: ABC transporter permease [Thermodesulfovibrionia bacterium]|nr:ABC transporter permease [Thermodesulfovibrionia bacterium]